MKYTESVCMGGIDEETLRMVRLYPMPLRYLEPEHQCHAFQWIKVKVKRDSSDSRPESYKVDFASIEPQEIIPSTKPNLRRQYLENSPSLCSSLEELLERQKADGTSLGIIVPKVINTVSIEMRTDKERKEWQSKANALLSRGSLFGEKVKQLDFPEAKFYVHWLCNDVRCDGHKMTIHQWGIHELYRKYKNDPDGNEKVIRAMYSRLDQDNKDVFLFLGNFSYLQYKFGLMDSYAARKRREDARQSKLF
jgi:hypothetical protein